MIKPYYESSLGKLYLGNCLEIMDDLPKEHVDLVVSSPPYNAGMEYEKILSIRQYTNFLYLIAQKIKSILCRSGRICWNVPYQFKEPMNPDKVFSQWACSFNSFVKAGLQFRDNITWNQSNSGNDCAWGSWKSASAPWLRHQTEAIMIFYNEEWKKEKKGESTINRNEFLKYVVDLWSMPTGKNKKHPAVFYIELPVRCLQLFSYKLDIVIDPFIGSGTTALACERLNRRWIGIEISEKYCEISAKRIETEASQLKLFR